MFTTGDFQIVVSSRWLGKVKLLHWILSFCKCFSWYPKASNWNLSFVEFWHSPHLGIGHHKRFALLLSQTLPATLADRQHWALCFLGGENVFQLFHYHLLFLSLIGTTTLPLFSFLFLLSYTVVIFICENHQQKAKWNAVKSGSVWEPLLL